MKEALAVLMVMIGLAGAAIADDYYVAQRNPAADDGNPGSAQKPFKTVSAAVPHVKAGDTVHVRAGVYREQVVLPKEDWNFCQWSWKKAASGKSIAQPIRFFAQEGEEVVIKGSDLSDLRVMRTF